MTFSHHDEQVGVRPGEHGDVHGHSQRVRFVQADAEVSLSAEQQQDEHADVHEADTSCTHTHKQMIFNNDISC